MEFKDQVAIVTGAGLGLGRAHALGLATRGAKVVVNDLGTDKQPSESALAVVKAIEAAGGQAMAHGADVADFAQVEDMVQRTMDQWGRVDILINNAGILRDKSFSKISLDDFRLVMDVHVMGAVHSCKAVWAIMKEQNYGRIVMTTSASGLFGNFGQSNYAAAKMALVGLMNTLAIEGKKYHIHVNGLSPAAATQMTEDIFPDDIKPLLSPETVAPAVLFLASEQAPTKTIITAAGGVYGATRIYETQGVYLPSAQQTPEGIAAHWEQVHDNSQQQELADTEAQIRKLVMSIMAAKKA